MKSEIAYLSCPKCGEIFEVSADASNKPQTCPNCKSPVIPESAAPPVVGESWAEACERFAREGKSLVGASPAPKPDTTSPTHICETCGTVSRPYSTSGGSFLVGLLLWLFFLIPGIIYTAWCLTSQKLACPSCRSKSVIPLGSPKGQQLLRASGQTTR